MQGETNYISKSRFFAIKDLKQGDFLPYFKTSYLPNQTKYTKEAVLERSEKNSSCTAYDDFCAERFYKGF